VPPEGTEHPANSAEKPGVGKKSGAESGAVASDPDLAELVNTWAGLPGALRAAILTMIRTGC
jgi:hypothetical protein